MSQKPGRNDPCPCLSLRDDQMTGTPLDAYNALLPLLAINERKIVQFDPDGPELKKARKSYEKRYRPGENGGLLDSHYVSWLYFDLRFGKDRRTLVERVLEDPLIAKLVEPGPTCLRYMAASYATFYEVLEEGPDVVLLDELGTGRRWQLHYFREIFGIPSGKGEIWYTRLLGPPEQALSYTTPYVYEPETRAQFRRGVDGHMADFLKSPVSIGVSAGNMFGESQKQSALFWAEYILVSNNATAEMLSSVPSEWRGTRLPHIVNKDKDDIVFTEMHFRVKDEAAVRKRLDKLKTFVHDGKDDSWTWLKAPSRRFPDEPRTELGHFQFKDGKLVAETNSRERAARLEWKLLGHFRGMLRLEKTLYRQLDDPPRESPEELEKMRRETEEFNARPEVREALRQHMEKHYFERWPRQKVPALGNITPLQAAKTEEGRRKLADLLDYYDRRQDANPTGRPKVDFDRLRHMLGLPARSH